MKVFIILLAVFLLTVFVVAIKVIKFYKSGELDIDTWTRIIFDTATERDKERYKKYRETKRKSRGQYAYSLW